MQATHESLHKAASTLETPCNVPGFGGGGGGSHPAGMPSLYSTTVAHAFTVEQ